MSESQVGSENAQSPNLGNLLMSQNHTNTGEFEKILFPTSLQARREVCVFVHGFCFVIKLPFFVFLILKDSNDNLLL